LKLYRTKFISQEHIPEWRQRMVKLTIQQVAQRAGVGVGTVSRVLNNHPAVRPETRDRIMGVMNEMGYTPNPHARRVAGGKSYTISIILPVISTDFYLRLLSGLERTFEAHRYDSALFPLLGRERLERYLSSSTLAYQADGLVLASHNLADLYQDGHLPTRQPVVMVDASSPHYDSVFMDNRLGGDLAGHTLIGFDGTFHAMTVHQALDEALSSSAFPDRLAGFTGVLESNGRSLAEGHAHVVSFNLDSARAAAREILTHHKPPINIFAAADLLALGVIDEAERMGLEIGRDVRLIGFDDHPWTEARQLTTLHQPIEAMGAAAAELLMDRLNGYDGPPRQVRFEARLIERGSTLTKSGSTLTKSDLG
jgi:LacI family transcriptional regulator